MSGLNLGFPKKFTILPPMNHAKSIKTQPQIQAKGNHGQENL